MLKTRKELADSSSDRRFAFVNMILYQFLLINFAIFLVVIAELARGIYSLRLDSIMSIQYRVVFLK